MYPARISASRSDPEAVARFFPLCLLFFRPFAHIVSILILILARISTEPGVLTQSSVRFRKNPNAKFKCDLPRLRKRQKNVGNAYDILLHMVRSYVEKNKIMTPFLFLFFVILRNLRTANKKMDQVIAYHYVFVRH